MVSKNSATSPKTQPILFSPSSAKNSGFWSTPHDRGAYLGIIFVAWQTIRRPRDSFGRMLAFGTACMIGFQALINIAVATVSVPTKGLSLPLISGGTGINYHVQGRSRAAL